MSVSDWMVRLWRRPSLLLDHEVAESWAVMHLSVSCMATCAGRRDWYMNSTSTEACLNDTLSMWNYRRGQGTNSARPLCDTNLTIPEVRQQRSAQ